MCLSEQYAYIPVSVGGLGLGSWDAKTFISKKGNKIPVNIFEELNIKIDLLNKNDDRKIQILRRFDKYKLHLTDV